MNAMRGETIRERRQGEIMGLYFLKNTCKVYGLEISSAGKTLASKVDRHAAKFSDYTLSTTPDFEGVV